MSTENISIHLPDGSVREVPQGTTPLDIANSISPRLAAASVVARLTPLTSAEPTAREGSRATAADSEASMYAAENAAAPRLVDLSTPLTADTRAGTGEGKRSRRAEGGAPLGRARAGHGGPRAVS